MTANRLCHLCRIISHILNGFFERFINVCARTNDSIAVFSFHQFLICHCMIVVCRLILGICIFTLYSNQILFSIAVNRYDIIFFQRFNLINFALGKGDLRYCRATIATRRTGAAARAGAAGRTGAATRAGAAARRAAGRAAIVAARRAGATIAAAAATAAGSQHRNSHDRSQSNCGNSFR